MRLLIITNYNHKVSKQLIKYLKFKKINFDLIDSSKKKKIKISKKYDYLISLLNKANLYGSTVHEINDKFDNGKILRVNTFKVSYNKLSLEKLITMTHKSIIKQAKNFINDILNEKLNIDNKFKWKKKAFTKKEFEIAREIKLKDSKKDILKKIKAFTYKKYESVYINLKGFKFEFKKK